MNSRVQPGLGDTPARAARDTVRDHDRAGRQRQHDTTLFSAPSPTEAHDNLYARTGSG